MAKQNIVNLRVADLHLWSENPRDHVEVKDSDLDVMRRAIENNNGKWNLKRFIDEMGEFYDLSELPTVVEIDGKYVVYDGNRRIAVLKYLQNESLYSGLGGGLFFKLEPKELRELTEIPCNVCDRETALKNVERKHVNSGSWDALERDYFLHVHRGQEKTLFLMLEEHTGIVGGNPKINQRFVKDEVLTEQNLKDIGIGFDPQRGFETNYTDSVAGDLIKKTVQVVEDGSINTRGKNRKKLKDTLIERFPELKNVIKSFDKTKNSHLLSGGESISGSGQSIPLRKTRRTKSKDLLFGRDLYLRSGQINDLYLAILKIYDQNKEDESILPIIGMCLRLILDVAAREFYIGQGSYEEANHDQLYTNFLKMAQGDMKSQATINYLALTSDWLSGKLPVAALLAKYAHGNIITVKRDVLKTSSVVADILETYFKR